LARNERERALLMQRCAQCI